ncbi:MAG: ParB N-terminal domain-containing protein [Magnetococcus sp. YQC-3]
MEPERKTVNRAFELKGVTVPISRLTPTKVLPTHVLKSSKYKQTETSIREIGIIEPPVVFRKRDGTGNYLLLDGHLRVQILENLGHTDVFCLISTDDEAYSYNKMVNRLSAIQEHYMVLKALDRGVSEETLAKHLGLNIDSIRDKRNLLKGICEEVVDLLKSRDVPGAAFVILRKMKPMRQIQVAELMISANNFSIPYAKAMLALTPSEQLLDWQPTLFKEESLTPEQTVSIERELAQLESEFKMAEQNLGDEVLSMVVYSGYLSKLIKNTEVSDFLSSRYQEIYGEFQRIAKTSSTDDKT